MKYFKNFFTAEARRRREKTIFAAKNAKSAKKAFLALKTFAPFAFFAARTLF
jgi:hypothetical protein